MVVSRKKRISGGSYIYNIIRVHARQLFRENYAHALRYTAITWLCTPCYFTREEI